MDEAWTDLNYGADTHIMFHFINVDKLAICAAFNWCWYNLIYSCP